MSNFDRYAIGWLLGSVSIVLVATVLAWAGPGDDDSPAAAPARPSLADRINAACGTDDVGDVDDFSIDGTVLVECVSRERGDYDMPLYSHNVAVAE